MKVKKLFCLVLACIATISFQCINISATESTNQGTNASIARASERFSMDIMANSISLADSSFPLEVGERVTIKASYSPFTADVDFGLIAPDGLFYSINVTTGSIDRTIQVNQRGDYTFAVRNNSSETVSVSGYVNY